MLFILLLAVWVSRWINDIAKTANFNNNGDKQIEFGLIGGVENEYNGAIILDISTQLTPLSSLLSTPSSGSKTMF